MLIISPLFKSDPPLDTNQPSNFSATSQPLELAISNLIYCLKIWHKFILHKEYYTIVTKCLSNSKLDSLNCYKNFLADYYNSYQLAVSNNPSGTHSWSIISSLNYKQKIPLIAYLFMNEKTSFKVENFNIFI